MNMRERFESLMERINDWAVGNGFWKPVISKGGDLEILEQGSKIALMHSELSEALEAVRKGRPKDQHLPERDNLTVELADCVIRIMDFSYY